MKSLVDPPAVRCLPSFAQHLAGAFLAVVLLVSMGAATRRDQEIERGRCLAHRLGIHPGSGTLRPPPPECRLTREDADAVVAFLNSLKKESAPHGPRVR